ncbi:MAG: GH1 family beta-glucosidase [Methylotetracoccus sp.]|nr:GH1 family beta-glucosidase [Methylotetracoccus sp.]
MSESGSFPSAFLWGAATSAYQIEGSPLADGAGPSNWHQFCHEPGHIENGESGDVACDHYRRYREDVELMARIGIKAYRFSISWSRVLPKGCGTVNEKGLEFYRRLSDSLLENGIQPFATLYHWDLPAALEARGGWAHPDCAHWFADYALVLFQRLRDQIPYWATLNEPWVVVHAGYIEGSHPPGLRSPATAPRVTHTLLRGHALAVQAFRAEGSGHGQIGLVVNLEPKRAASSDPADLAAMERAHAYMNRQFLDPVLLGAYPDEMAAVFGRAWPRFPDQDMRLIREPIDFLGINYYSRSVVRDDPAGDLCGVSRVRQAAAEHTAMDWEVFPEGLESCLLWVRRRYGALPLYVTENGAAFEDAPMHSTAIKDVRRLDYLRRHLLAARRAMAAGVDLRGYFVWSLLDNFEWTHGYAKRFGIVGVDFPTQRRILKDSGKFYSDVIRSQGALLDP